MSDETPPPAPQTLDGPDSAPSPGGARPPTLRLAEASRTSRPPSGWPPWVDEWILPYLENRALWPVWVAVIGHVVVAVAGLGLLVYRTGLPEAGIALGLLGILSGWLVVREWQLSASLGGVTLTVALAWATSLGLAALAEATGLF